MYLYGKSISKGTARLVDSDCRAALLAVVSAMDHAWPIGLRNITITTVHNHVVSGCSKSEDWGLDEDLFKGIDTVREKFKNCKIINVNRNNKDSRKAYTEARRASQFDDDDDCSSSGNSCIVAMTSTEATFWANLRRPQTNSGFEADDRSL